MLQKFPVASDQVAAATAVWQATYSADLVDVRQLFVPYRICPLGAHIDHQGGHVLSRTIPSGTLLIYLPLTKPEIRLASTNFSGSLSFEIGTPVQPVHWGRYAQAAALTLGQTYTLTRGFLGVSSGTLVSAGLGSSASVGLAYLQALANVNDISLTKAELVELDRQLERNYLGLQNGILDQSSILYGHDKALVYIDTRLQQSRLIFDPPAMANAGWLIVTSGVTRELSLSGGYNQRVAECLAAAQWLQPTAVTLSDVPLEMFKAHGAAMPDPLHRRATHFFEENARVSAGVAAWQAGNLTHFGSLMNASCASSIYHYESGHQAIIALQEIVSGTPGVYGSRFSGGGYGGCVIGLVERIQAEAAADQIWHRYRQQYPALAADAAIFWVSQEVAV